MSPLIRHLRLLLLPLAVLTAAPAAHAWQSTPGRCQPKKKTKKTTKK